MRKKESVTVKCQQCEKEIQRDLRVVNARKSGRFFCSQSCSATFRFSGSNHPRWNGAGTVNITCQHCSKEFTAERNMKVRLNRRFCSQQCGASFQSAQTPKVSIECKQCGRSFSMTANSHAVRRTFCGLKCRSAFYDRSGDKNPRWKGGISSERDKIKATEEYKQWRLSVFRRDHFTCVTCLSKSVSSNKIEAHHLKTFAAHPALAIDVENGCTLCARCHKKTYQAEEILEVFLRSRILRDFTPDTRCPVDLAKIKSDLRSDTKNVAEMPTSARVGAVTRDRTSSQPTAVSPEAISSPTEPTTRVNKPAPVSLRRDNGKFSLIDSNAVMPTRRKVSNDHRDRLSERTSLVDGAIVGSYGN